MPTDRRPFHQFDPLPYDAVLYGRSEKNQRLLLQQDRQFYAAVTGIPVYRLPKVHVTELPNHAMSFNLEKREAKQEASLKPKL